ncbi:ribosomal L4/L1 family protein, partial [Chlamydia psittaci C1/97]
DKKVREMLVKGV